MDVAQGQVGPEAAYDVKVEDGKLVIVAKYDGVETDAELMVKVDAAAFIDKLAALIPGSIDDAVLGVIKAALLK